MLRLNIITQMRPYGIKTNSNKHLVLLEKTRSMAEDKKSDLKEHSQDKVAISRRKLGGEAPMVVSEIVEGCLYSGMYGTLDSARIKAVVDLILDLTSTSDADMIIIDLSNVDIIDSAISSQLVKVNKTLHMVGMQAIFCGIKPIVAQSMVNAGVDIGLVDVKKNLKSALTEVYFRMGLKLVQIED